RPNFHHGEEEPARRPKQKKLKKGREPRRASIGDKQFGQSPLSDEELRETINPRTIAAARIDLARPRADDQGLYCDEDSKLSQDLMSTAPSGHENGLKHWTRALRAYTAQGHPEEFALIQLKLAQLFYAKGLQGTDIKEVLKCLENSLQHYNTCIKVYNPTRFPRRWATAALEMGMAFGALADLTEKEIPRFKPDSGGGEDAERRFYKEIAIMTAKARGDYRQRSLDNIDSAIQVLIGDNHLEERAKAQMEKARGLLRKLSGDMAENRELAVVSLEDAIKTYEVGLVHPWEEERGALEGSDHGPAHAYYIPVGARPAGADGRDGGGEEGEGDVLAPVRETGIKAAYGRALGMAGKQWLDKQALTLGGDPEAGAMAVGRLEKAAEVRGWG
ncbi:unnamed protein product, partial [Discosporangium mesarthrocarpum]